MRPEEIQALVKRYLDGSATAAEKELLDKWYQEGQSDPVKWFAESENEEDLLRLEMLQEIRQRAGLKKESTIKRLWPRIAAAASILIFLSVGYFVWHNKREQAANRLSVVHDIAPGHNQATLTLANGKKIVLVKGLSGLLAVQGKTNINAANDQITYTPSQRGDQLSYNTMSTAKGEQSPYPLVLADGTKVWLNAESSITFPTTFNDNERTVSVTGEAYFEVAHNAKHPFKVQTEKQTIEDIGTAFDVNAYADEPVVKTTLLQGAVRVSAGNQSVLLQPGDQAQNLKVVHDADLDGAVAWKNDLFQFSGSDVKEAMRQFARWYDVDVSYEGEMPDVAFGGKISRKVKASEVFEALKRYHLNFKIEGKKVIVSKR